MYAGGAVAKITPSGDCGNSPKNIFVEKMTIALATHDGAFLKDSLVDDAVWHIVGKGIVYGRQDLDELSVAQAQNLAELTITHVLTHGKTGAVNGTRTYTSGVTEAFCDVYEFFNAKATKIQHITSYIIAD